MKLCNPVHSNWYLKKDSIQYVDEDYETKTFYGFFLYEIFLFKKKRREKDNMY